MLNRAIILVISLFIISSCVTGPEGYFKKSANNKLFDRKGFKGGKRAPLYNKKYIAKAKQNVASNDYGDDEELDDDLFENENISQANRDMYREMLEQEIENKYLGKGRGVSHNRAYPSVIRTNARTVNAEETDNIELRAEIEQIKSMLKDTKNEMASYRCPTAQDLERVQGKVSNNGQKSTKKQSSPEGVTIIEPVKSI